MKKVTVLERDGRWERFSVNTEKGDAVMSNSAGEWEGQTEDEAEERMTRLRVDGWNEVN